MRRLAFRALPGFGVEPASVRLLSHGHNTSFTVRATDGSQYLLRIHGIEDTPLGVPQRRSRVESEIWWLNRLLADLNAPVPIPVPALDGDAVIEIADEIASRSRPCVLLRWMEGRFFNRGLKPGHLERVGRLTATLHNHSARLSVPPGFDRQHVDRTDEGLEEETVRLFAERSSSTAAKLVRQGFRRVRAAQQELSAEPGTYGLIHADIHQFNYLFDRGEVRLIDFDDSGWGHYLYDLAVTIMVFSRLPQEADLRRALIAGYRQVRPLSEREASLIDTFRMLREIQDMTWSLRDPNTLVLGNPQIFVSRGMQTLERLLLRSPGNQGM